MNCNNYKIGCRLRLYENFNKFEHSDTFIVVQMIKGLYNGGSTVYRLINLNSKLSKIGY